MEPSTTPYNVTLVCAWAVIASGASAARVMNFRFMLEGLLIVLGTSALAGCAFAFAAHAQ
ncbi:hypothetical protein D3C85_1548680 [compost metagenome]